MLICAMKKRMALYLVEKKFTKGTNLTVFEWHVYDGIQLWKKGGQHFFWLTYNICSFIFLTILYFHQQQRRYGVEVSYDSWESTIPTDWKQLWHVTTISVIKSTFYATLSSIQTFALNMPTCIAGECTQ